MKAFFRIFVLTVVVAVIGVFALDLDFHKAKVQDPQAITAARTYLTLLAQKNYVEAYELTSEKNLDYETYVKMVQLHEFPQAPIALSLLDRVPVRNPASGIPSEQVRFEISGTNGSEIVDVAVAPGTDGKWRASGLQFPTAK